MGTMHPTDILSEIDTFMTEHGLSEAQFCRVINHGRFFERLNHAESRGKPYRIWPETERRIREAMRQYREKAAA